MSSAATITAVKGFRDVLPDEAGRWRELEDAAARLFARYGFEEIRLPIVERTELFVRSLGDTTDVVEKEMYSFVDRDDTALTLRPEATASVVRAYVEGGLVQRDPTARLWYRGPMFRRERPQRGRYRQFYQIGAEVFGRDDPLADAELLVMLMRYLEQVGARDTCLELNSVGDTRCRPAYRERLREFGQRELAALCPDCHRRLERNPLRIFDCKVESCRAVVAAAPLVVDSLCDGCRTHLAGMRALLELESASACMLAMPSRPTEMTMSATITSMRVKPRWMPEVRLQLICKSRVLRWFSQPTFPPATLQDSGCRQSCWSDRAA